MKVSLAAFFAIWADSRRWKVPDIHWRAVHWLEHRGELAVLRCFRGFGKSTLLEIYNAWRYYDDGSYRILHQSESDPTAYKTSRGTKNVLLKHPLTRGDPQSGAAPLFKEGAVETWWVQGNDDPRNGSMFAKGILSNVTSARADEAQNDDVEVPRNIRTPEAREQMRYRLGEQTHILVPGGRTLYIGTPHTHDSIYDEQESMGADCLTIKMFSQEHRIEDATAAAYPLPFVPDMVFSGIGKSTKLLEEGVDYQLKGKRVVFAAAPGGLIDFYAGSAWPERFDKKEMLKRRKRCRTVNEWDSQYQLHSKPIHEVRLNPENIQAYDCEPRFTTANKIPQMWLGKVQLVGVSLRWDPSSGKINSDVSGVCLDFQDAAGRHYWHRMQALTGEIAETNEDGTRITGGQVWQLCDLVKQFRIPRVTVETNGIGKLAPSFLRMALKQRQIKCAVAEVDAVVSKNPRILEALEPLIQSRMLWAHVSVLDGELWDQMKDWNPAVREQPDDLLDAGAGAVTDQPARVGQLIKNLNTTRDDDWRPSVGVYESSFDD